MLTQITRILKWLYPGIGIKRWMGLSAFGAILLIIGSSGLQSRQFFIIRALGSR